MTSAEYDKTFKLPFNEASEFFQRKLNIPTRAWTDLWQGEHAKGFMSSGAMDADLLTDLRKMTQKAIDGGMDIREFRTQFRPLVEKYGWQLKGGGPGWRADLIFRTNISTAYAAGRWQQFKAAGITWLAADDFSSLIVYGYYRSFDVVIPYPTHSTCSLEIEGLT